MFNSVFKIVFFILFVAAVIIRKLFTARFRKLNDLEVDKRSTGDMVWLAFNGIGMVIPLVYVFSTALDFANYTLPPWLGWLGALLFAIAVWLLWRSHVDLGKNWTPILAIRMEHELVTTGIFKHIRHPMYAAHLLWSVAQILMLHNWIAGFSFFIVQLPFVLIRIRAEEKMMIWQFGDQYSEYHSKTGALWPKIFKK